MVSVAFGVGMAAATAGTTVSVGAAMAIAAGGMLAAYIDQQYVYPAMFGKKNPRPDALEGFQLSTTDPGSPRWEVYGSRAWVPCHYLWSLNLREEVTGNGAVGKGGRPFVQTMRADVGLAACDGPITFIDTLYADERPFWSRQFNRVVMEDSRWVIYAGTGPDVGRLVVQATDFDVGDFAGVFSGGNAREFARLEGVTPAGLNGYYRTVWVGPHGGASGLSAIVLQPLQGQTPAAGVAGNAWEPARLRRLDQGVAAHTWVVNQTGQDYVELDRPIGDIWIPGPPALTDQQMRAKWAVGAVYRFSGFSAAAVNGLYKLQSWGPTFQFGTYRWRFVRMEAQPMASWIASPGGTLTTPGIIIRDEASGLMGDQGRGFVFADTEQEYAQYQGTDDQSQDPTLATLEVDPPAHRGIAHISISNWNLGPHSNQFPRVVALVRARPGETVGAAIDRICKRTMPADHVDVGRLRPKALLGYSVPGGLASGPALQPLQTMYGVVMQDRGGVLTFLDERDLPIVAVATRHLNARASREQTRVRGFVASRIDKADVPERIVLQYIDPVEGANEAEGDGARAPGSDTRGRRDTVPVNLKPLVVWGYEAKRRARELRRRQQMESHRGTVRLGPGYMDVLPATCLTFRSNNWQQDEAPGLTTIAFDTVLRDIVERSVSVLVRFSNGQVATLQDNGSGVLVGLPSGITASVNAVDYDAGRVDLTTSVTLDTTFAPIISYSYEKQWLLRVSKATFMAHDKNVACQVVRTTTDDPLPPVPRDLPGGLGGPIVTAVPRYRVHVLDIPALYPGQTRAVLFGVAAAGEAGGPWRGAVVYRSPNGVDRWSPLGQIQVASVIGTVPVNNLPDSSAGFGPGVIDWTTELTIELPYGETLSNSTTEQISWGDNWLLVGDEIIAFHEAEAGTGTEWILRGLVRGLRHTTAGMDTHADGERVVLLTGLGGLHGLLHEPIGGLAAANRTYYLRVVPGGGSIDDVATIETLITGRSALPAAPQMIADDLTQIDSGALQLTWRRRSIDQSVLFGPSPLQAGEFERYQVVAFDILTAAGLIASLGTEGAIAATATQTWEVGNESMGTPLVNRMVHYSSADMVSHGYTLGVTPVGFVVYQVGATGKSARSDILFATPT